MFFDQNKRVLQPWPRREQVSPGLVLHRDLGELTQWLAGDGPSLPEKRFQDQLPPKHTEELGESAAREGFDTGLE